MCKKEGGGWYQFCLRKKDLLQKKYCESRTKINWLKKRLFPNQLRLRSFCIFFFFSCRWFRVDCSSNFGLLKATSLQEGGFIIVVLYFPITFPTTNASTNINLDIDWVLFFSKTFLRGTGEIAEFSKGLYFVWFFVLEKNISLWRSSLESVETFQ